MQDSVDRRNEPGLRFGFLDNHCAKDFALGTVPRQTTVPGVWAMETTVPVSVRAEYFWGGKHFWLGALPGRIQPFFAAFSRAPL